MEQFFESLYFIGIACAAGVFIGVSMFSLVIAIIHVLRPLLKEDQMER